MGCQDTRRMYCALSLEIIDISPSSAVKKERTRCVELVHLQNGHPSQGGWCAYPYRLLAQKQTFPELRSMSVNDPGCVKTQLVI